MSVAPILAGLMVLVSLLIVAPGPSWAVEYTLEIANLQEEAFSYYVRGPVGRGVGEARLPDLGRSLDAGGVGAGALLFDRAPDPARATEARSLGATPVRTVKQAGPDDTGEWTVVRWEGNPGERTVWVIRGATSRQKVGRLALGGSSGDLRFFLPYAVTSSPHPSAAVAYPLTFLRASEDGLPVWEKSLARAVDLSDGLAAVVGQDGVGGDWVYLIVDQPPQPTTFKAVVGWNLKGVNDRNHIHGTPARPGR